jgi:hypothetical protein
MSSGKYSNKHHVSDSVNKNTHSIVEQLGLEVTKASDAIVPSVLPSAKWHE